MFGWPLDPKAFRAPFRNLRKLKRKLPKEKNFQKNKRAQSGSYGRYGQTLERVLGGIHEKVCRWGPRKAMHASKLPKRTCGRCEKTHLKEEKKTPLDNSGGREGWGREEDTKR